MVWDRETWRKNVSGLLFEMACIKFQEAIWQAKIPGMMHSFSELICNIEDYAIPEGLDSFVKANITSHEEAEVLEKISANVDILLKKYPSITEWEAPNIIGNEDWLAIAKEARALFVQHFLNDFIKYPDQERVYNEWWKQS